ncbi:hypothetical protein GCM10018780_30780 [Streptomyces lanatus]|nr:hypothetical protein GCM10018780_30780 [Streptomyces lanatus]
MQIGDDAGVRQGREFLMGPAVFLTVGGGPEHPEFPAFGTELRNRAVVRDRPAALHTLSRWKLGVCCCSTFTLHRLTHGSILTDPKQCT